MHCFLFFMQIFVVLLRKRKNKIGVVGSYHIDFI